MTTLDQDMQAVAPADFQKHALGFIDAFIQQAEFRPFPDVRLSVYRTHTAYQAVCRRSIPAAVHSELRNGALTIHLCLEDLKDIPLPALQGLLDLEMASVLCLLRHESFPFNFRNQILTLFPVAGSAVQLIRHLVEHLKSGLKSYFATQELIDMNRGNCQVYFYFWKIRPAPDEETHYQRLRSHKWLKAVFLARKLEELLPVALLADHSMIPHLKSFWWDCHAYLLTEDRHLLQEQTAIPARQAPAAFADILVEMFKAFMVRLLGPS